MHSHCEQLLNQLRVDSMTHDPSDVSARFDAYCRLVADFGTSQAQRFDAGEQAFLARQLLFVQSKQVTELTRALKAELFVARDMSIPSGADSYSTPILKSYGSAKFVDSGVATDFPSVSLEMGEKTSGLYSLGNSYDWTVQDLRRAAMAGMPLSDRKAAAARLVHETKVDSIVALGDTAHSIQGLATQTSVNTAGNLLAAGGALNGDWGNSATTAQEMLDDLSTIENHAVLTHGDAMAPNALILDPYSLKAINTKRISNATDKTVLRSFLDNSIYIKSIDSWDKLQAAGESSVTRAICYKRDSAMQDFKVPQAFEQFAPQQEGFLFRVLCHSRIGGVALYYPMSMVYADDLYTIT